jgi:regulator of sigma E protease
MNFLTGVLIILALYSQSSGFVVPTVAGFLDGYGLEDCGLQAGDVIVSINGHRMYSYSDLSLYLSRADDSIDWVVKRDGQKVTLKDVYMPLQERTDEDGQTTYLRGLSVGRAVLPGTVGNKILYSWYGALDYVRMVWLSLGDLVRGAVGLRDLSGPVGITSTLAELGSDPELSPTLADAIWNIASLAALIAVNLAVMNLLPLPALDGGRIFFLLLNGVLYFLFRKKISSQYESYVHAAGMAALMLLMVVVTLSDVGKLLGR